MEIIKFLGGTTIVLGSVAWLFRSLVIHLLGKDVERFKQKVKYEAEHGNSLLAQKIKLYKEVADPFLNLVVKIEHQGILTVEDLQNFDKDRLSTTALLGMFAAKDVFNEYNDMIDYIYDSFEKKQIWSFSNFRKKALIFLNKVRNDIGLCKNDISYKGTR